MVNACMGSQYRSLLLQGNSMKKKTFPAHVNTAILIAKRIHDENQVQLLKDRRVVDAGTIHRRHQGSLRLEFRTAGRDLDEALYEITHEFLQDEEWGLMSTDRHVRGVALSRYLARRHIELFIVPWELLLTSLQDSLAEATGTCLWRMSVLRSGSVLTCMPVFRFCSRHSVEHAQNRRATPTT